MANQIDNKILCMSNLVPRCFTGTHWLTEASKVLLQIPFFIFNYSRGPNYEDVSYMNLIFPFL